MHVFPVAGHRRISCLVPRPSSALSYPAICAAHGVVCLLDEPDACMACVHFSTALHTMPDMLCEAKRHMKARLAPLQA